MRSHWHAQSEPFTGGDSLLVLLQRGWRFSVDFVHREYFRIKDRWITVYHFYLKRRQQRRVMRVIHNPFIDRLIAEHRLHVEPLDEPVKQR